ncbi:hypothetical protein SERLA73DRAFT_185437 [Serpula lacrymans var. lacrymans S7.3]|uniref:Uncharacterized protein n=2 Tax=Serpula lacrymans var. lacrymans TaxID=341189 RepID=F8Q5T7_SERL3|nr:uncharacterized protein SERLADRAFT_473928 [Serpula lacrymans var. lacrymans S7.9]EGN95975.1 hypothetical protein SERLA73DRAFT_185437 [Serpula lacrymans var. lacrymans S7.3]EGO21500.1 hypothetical protein SERLADRAFT_473928 [Serpula lacrymans var. lacrymans S7.9]
MRSVWGIICGQFNAVPPVENADLTGKTVIVVGANVGIGFEASKHFARMNPARLILGCRSTTKGTAAIEEIKSETGYDKAELWLIDLANFSSVLAFADKFDKEGQGLDILVMNAAVFQLAYQGTPDGWETSIQVNHLSTALLSILLTPHLISAGGAASLPSRLAIVASDVHYVARFEKKVTEAPKILEKLSSEEYCTPSVMRARYNDSKLLNVFFARAFNSHLPQTTPLTVSAVNPGFCYSQLRRDMYDRFFYNLIMRIGEILLAWTTEEGSRQLVFAAVGARDKEGEERMKGAFISQSKVIEPSDLVLSKEGGVLQERLWNETIEILSEISPRVREIVNNYLQ